MMITKAPAVPEPEADYTNKSGTMVVTRGSTPKLEDKKEINYANSTGTMMMLNTNSPSSPEGNYANSTGTMVVTKTIKKDDHKNDRAKYREEFGSLSEDQLKQWQDIKLEKKYKKEYEKLLRKWKEEKSAVLDALRKKEIETIEQKYQQLQLDLERELQEKREKVEKI